VTGVLNNGLNLANVDPYLQKIALGAVILGAVLLDQKLAKS
jgi:ribose transport system permease protein